MAAALGVSRATVYRLPHPRRADEPAVRNAIVQIAGEFTRYGYRPVTRELRRRRWVVNEKRVRRIMREEHLQGSNKRFSGAPTYVRHLPVYPNRAAQTPVTDLDQLRVSDLTYVRLRSCWIFVAVIMDALVDAVSAGRWRPTWESS